MRDRLSEVADKLLSALRAAPPARGERTSAIHAMLDADSELRNLSAEARGRLCHRLDARLCRAADPAAERRRRQAYYGEHQREIAQRRKAVRAADLSGVRGKHREQYRRRRAAKLAALGQVYVKGARLKNPLAPDPGPRRQAVAAVGRRERYRLDPVRADRLRAEARERHRRKRAGPPADLGDRRP